MKKNKNVLKNWRIRLHLTTTLGFWINLTAPLWFRRMRLMTKTLAHSMSRSKVDSTSRIKRRNLSPRTVLSSIHSFNPCPNSHLELIRNPRFLPSHPRLTLTPHSVSHPSRRWLLSRLESSVTHQAIC